MENVSTLENASQKVVEQSSPQNTQNISNTSEQSTNKINQFFSKAKNLVISKKKIFIPAGIGIIALVAISSYLIFKPGGSSGLFFQNLGNKQAGPYKINYEFAKYNLLKTPFKPSVPDYSMAVSEITNLSAFEQDSKKPFSDSQKSALESTNFFITPNLDKFWLDDLEAVTNRTDDWTKLYDDIGGGPIWDRKPENSVFITSDFLLHVYHRLLEKEFEYVEYQKFYPSLKEITDKIFSGAVQNYSREKDKDNKESYERIIAFFAVPKAILDSSYEEFSSSNTEDKKFDAKENVLKKLDDLKKDIPGVSYQKAKEELNLVLDEKALEQSPLFGELLSEYELEVRQDYSQFTPRSHYNKNSVLRTYFRAMMWYGRNNFALVSPKLTRDALNISVLMKNTGQLKNWESIYIPTAFLVGKSDDLGVYEYVTSIEKFGATSVTGEVVVKTQEGMKNYQDPQIQSSSFFGNQVFDTTKQELLQKTKGFRFMGQRFTPDAFIFTSLTQGDEKPDPESGEKLPSSTTALAVMSILGNKTADPLVQDWINTNATGSKNVLSKNVNSLKSQFEKIPEDVWTQNIYWGWLYTIKSLFTESIDKTGYPMFVKNEAWNKKNLQASLGSWTELKHDTLLYAKQTYTEQGAGGDAEIPPVPKGYVEPNIPFFDRLIGLAQMTEDGLKNRGLIDGVFIGRSQNFLEALKFFKGIAVKQLQNEKISDDEFEELRNKGGYLSIVLEPIPGEEMLEKNARSALIADVHTDTIKGEILYEADGIPNYIWVSVKDQNGTRLTKGLVFNYYEFTAPLGQRLTDESWRTLNYTLDKSKLPQSPSWVNSLFK